MRFPQSLYLATVMVVASTTLSAQAAVSIPDRLRGAERVVVAQVGSMTATYQTNEFGDRLIVSHLALAVEETLKGPSTPALSLDVDGGTLGGLTLEVSSLPKMHTGERAVFFVTADKHGHNVPHLRGQGILKLDAQNRVKGSTLDLSAIRQMALTTGGR